MLLCFGKVATAFELNSPSVEDDFACDFSVLCTEEHWQDYYRCQTKRKESIDGRVLIHTKGVCVLGISKILAQNIPELFILFISF